MPPNTHPSTFSGLLGLLVIPLALVGGLKEIVAELTTLIHKGPKAAIAYYNDNYDRLRK